MHVEATFYKKPLVLSGNLHSQVSGENWNKWHVRHNREVTLMLMFIVHACVWVKTGSRGWCSGKYSHISCFRQSYFAV